ncbi:MAG: hypothetical protein ACD_62C00339G0008 [uncultured bacterium]|nr:MAG: hypothetical protein ACD_62C00339G0008 [uncultured bacterium]
MNRQSIHDPRSTIHFFQVNTIQLSHGSGGKKMLELIQNVIFKHLSSPELRQLDDSAELSMKSSRIAFTTDSFVVKPIFFPGGTIGSLAVSGTVNDLLMKGAQPRHLSLGLIIEDGFPLSDLERILGDIAQACQEAHVSIATGDTKVVGRGEADQIFINTSGVGEILPHAHVSGHLAQNGDVVIVSGTIGEHGVAVMSQRNGLKLTGKIASDAAPLTNTVLPLLEKWGTELHVLRDPTRGGVATTLNEIASASQVTITLNENDLPVSEPVQFVSNLLGFDPLYLPCEGRFLAIVRPEHAKDIVKHLHTLPHGAQARIIGEVTQQKNTSGVMLNTLTGGKRILDMPVGELLPRIC